MNGPEHYREAERLLDKATIDANGFRIIDVDERTAATIAAAQVHATLALVAATAEPRGTYTDPNLNYQETFIKGNAWVEVQS